MKRSTFASATVIGGSLVGSLMLSPVPGHNVTTTPVAAASALPRTGQPTAVLRIKHDVDLEAPQAPTEIYEQYVAPAAAAATGASAGSGPGRRREVVGAAGRYRHDRRARLSADSEPEL